MSGQIPRNEINSNPIKLLSPRHALTPRRFVGPTTSSIEKEDHKMISMRLRDTGTIPLSR